MNEPNDKQFEITDTWYVRVEERLKEIENKIDNLIMQLKVEFYNK